MSRGVLRTSLLLGVLLAGVLVLQYPELPSASTVKSIADRTTAPDFALTDARGATLKLSDYRGKVVLLNFWATWCGPCRVEIPWFSELEKTYGGRGLAVIGVSLDEDGWDAVRPYIARKKVNYPVVLGNDALAHGFGGVAVLPTTLLIDKQGRIAARHAGLAAKRTYKDEVANLLGIDQQ